MRLEFGKHRGQEIEDVPTDYLVWLFNKSKQNVECIREELEGRGLLLDEDDHEARSDGHVPQDLKTPLFRELLAAGFKAMANLHHPDHTGGDGEKMKQLNTLREKLRKEFR